MVNNIISKLPWLVSCGVFLVLSSLLLDSIDNPSFHRLIKTKASRDTGTSTTLMKESLVKYGFIVESSGLERYSFAMH